MTSWPTPARLSEVLTVTFSPGWNGWAGTKLPPFPSESPRMVPEWIPLREPVTVRPDKVRGLTLRNAIWVVGAATRLPGPGYAHTAADWASAGVAAPIEAARIAATAGPV